MPETPDGSAARRDADDSWRNRQSIWDKFCAVVFRDCQKCGSIHHRTEEHDDAN